MQIPATKKTAPQTFRTAQMDVEVGQPLCPSQMLVGTGPSNKNAPGQKTNILNQNSETTLLEAVL